MTTKSEWLVYKEYCPGCGQPSYVSQEDAMKWWRGGYWECPHCGRAFSRSEWDAHQRSRKRRIKT